MQKSGTMSFTKSAVCGCAIVATAVLFAGCDSSGVTSPAAVLQKADLPAVDFSTKAHGLPGRSICGALKEAEGYTTLVTATGRNDVWKGDVIQYTLKNDDVVDSSVFPDNSSSDTPASIVASVHSAITECTAKPTPAPARVEALTGLASDQTGYRYHYNNGAEVVVGERVFAVQGPRVVVVGAEHRGSGDLTVDVVKLLPKALDRAKKAPKS
jgi:hypothetical protein